MCISDFDKFTQALECYCRNRLDDDCHVEWLKFQNKIKDLECNDFRLYYYRAYYSNRQDQINDAKINIDKSVHLVGTINSSVPPFGENCAILLSHPLSHLRVPLPEIKKQISDVYFCAGEIYAKYGDENSSLAYYKLYQYYSSFFKSQFDDKDYLKVFSFRKYNEYSLADLIKEEITVCPSNQMNDNVDSLINLWREEENLKNICKEPNHVKPYSKSFDYYRVRSFSYGVGNAPVRNVLMWSHYAENHTGFCLKYKLSKRFICQGENERYEHMYLRRISYEKKKVDVSTSSMILDLAFTTKKKDWKYEREIRLVVYDPNRTEPFYGIKLNNPEDNSDTFSSIEAVFFGCKCPDATIEVVKAIFAKQYDNQPKFYKMVIDYSDVYNLKYIKI